MWRCWLSITAVLAVSAGRPHEAGVLADARAARDWLAERAQISARDIVLLGESIGGGVMVDLAAADGARGLILENTFTSIPDVAAHHFPWLPVRIFMRTKIDSLAKIGNYTGPLLQCHGDADTIIPFELGERLHRAARGPKKLVVVHGGDHNDPRSEQWLMRAGRVFRPVAKGLMPADRLRLFLGFRLRRIVAVIHGHNHWPLQRRGQENPAQPVSLFSIRKRQYRSRMWNSFKKQPL